MSFFLALDAGGTKTDYVLADETRELARVRTGTIKRMRVDAATACQNLESALAELSAQTGISMAVGNPHLRGDCGGDGSAGERLVAGVDFAPESAADCSFWVTSRSHWTQLFRVKLECWCLQAPVRMWSAAPGGGADFCGRMGAGAGRPGIRAHHRPGKPARDLFG